MTSAEVPYIGEQSMTLPPRAKNTRSTSARWSRRRRSSPTLKVIHEPMPTTGSASPLDGMARVIDAPCAFASLPAKGCAASPPSTVRREICRALVMQETWRRGAECQKAALPKLFAALGRGGDGAGHQGLEAVLGHEDLQRLQRGAAGRGHVFA